MTIASLPSSLTAAALCAWLGQALPGEALEYHRGFLACDTVLHAGASRLSAKLELIKIARQAWQAGILGYAHLVQRRHGPDDYSYLLIARPRRPSTPIAIDDLLDAPI